jgi:DNA recombination-dependent growth factor C
MIPGGWIMAVERRDRILPTTVIKSEVMKEVAGRDLSRIEIAELKSNVVDRLLAQALIKSKVIYLIVQSEYVYVTTGSDKEFGDVLYFVQDCLPNFVTATPEVFPQKWMRAKMFGDCDDVVSNMFKLQPTFTLKDSEGSKIAITDWTVEREALDEWLAQATPVAMSLAYTIDEDPILDFVLTDKFTIKSLTFMGGVDDVGTIEDFPGTAMIVTNTLNQVFPKLIALTAIEDDEL